MTPAWRSYVTLRVEYQVSQTDRCRASKSSTRIRDHRGSPPVTGHSSVMSRSTCILNTAFSWPKEQAAIVPFAIAMNETLTSLHKERHSFSVKEVTRNSGGWRISGQVWSLSRSSVVIKAVSMVERKRFVLTQNLAGCSASVLMRSATGTGVGDP